MSGFAPHGNARVSVRGRTVLFRPDGPGNREEIERLLGEIARLVAQLPAAGWGALVVLDGETLLTPDAEARLTEAMAPLAKSGLRGIALAVLRPALRGLAVGQFSRIGAAGGITVADFATESAAEAWLHGLR